MTIDYATLAAEEAELTAEQIVDLLAQEGLKGEIGTRVPGTPVKVTLGFAPPIAIYPGGAGVIQLVSFSDVPPWMSPEFAVAFANAFNASYPIVRCHVEPVSEDAGVFVMDHHAYFGPTPITADLLHRTIARFAFVIAMMATLGKEPN